MRKCLCLLLAAVLALGCPVCRAADESSFTFGMVFESGAVINPLYCNQRDLMSVNELVFESVIALDETLKPVGELALSWERSEQDKKEIVFHLRDNVRFHDGTYLSAQDVLASYNRILSIGSASPYYSRCSYITSMTVEGADACDLRVTGKYDSYLTLYAMTFPVLQRSSLDMNLPTGTGPYWYMYSDTEWIQLDANPYWWKKAAVVDTVYVLRYNETGDSLVALTSGEVDAVPTRSQNAALGRLLNDRISVDYSTCTYEMLIPNLRGERFGDIRTRQAIMYALDTDTIAQNIYMGMVMESEVPVITGSWIYEPQSAVYYESPERAYQLLEEAGWGDYDGDGILDRVVDGILVQLDFTILTCVDDAAATRQRAALLIADQLAALGIRVEVKVVSKAGLEKSLKNGDFDMVLCGINMSLLPDLTFLLDSSGRMNYSGYISGEMDQALRAVYHSADETAFRTNMSRIQTLTALDLPFMGLFFRKGTLMTTADVTGLNAIVEGDVLKGFEYIDFLD